MKPLAQEALDQGAHFIAGASVALLALILAPVAPIAAGGLVGLALGIVREVTEGGNVLSDGSRRDMLFWTLGGLAAGVGAALL